MCAARKRQRTVEIGHCCFDALVDGARRRYLRRASIDDLERQSAGALREFEHDGGIVGVGRSSTIR